MKVALVYDFDGTLSNGNMQDYSLIPEVFGMDTKEFWGRANKWGEEQDADQITSSMYYVAKVAEEKNISLTKEVFFEAGKSIKYFAGVEQWFDRINKYGDMLDLEIEHYVISAGYEEILEGCNIRKYFKDIFACAYAYNENGNPIWPARVVNYSTKTQYLSKINKGLGKLEDRAVNEFMSDDKRPIPLSKMVYFGDGITDIPSMRLVKKGGGYSIAVYQEENPHKELAVQLLKDERVNFALPTDYSDGSEIDNVIKTILIKLATERDLQILQDKENEKKK